MDLKDLRKKARWYLKYRTQIWSTIFLVVGLFGGSAAAIQAWIPSLKTDTETIEKKLEKIEAALDKLAAEDV